MNKQAERTAFCDKYCRDFDRCKIYWGADCRKYGGKKIPKMKAPLRENTVTEKSKVEPKPNKVKKSIADSIRTRVAGW